jgi:GTP cyclohydrolase FolE2
LVVRESLSEEVLQASERAKRAEIEVVSEIFVMRRGELHGVSVSDDYDLKVALKRPERFVNIVKARA